MNTLFAGAFLSVVDAAPMQRKLGVYEVLP